MEGSNHVFISYARADVERLRDVMIALKPVILGLRMRIWQDGNLTTGDIRNDEIQAAMDRAAIFIPLVSMEYLASDFIRAHEMPTMLLARSQRKALVLPVILNECFWTLDFGDIEAAPLDPNRRVRPISKFRSRVSGLHAAAEEVLKALRKR